MKRFILLAGLAISLCCFSGTVEAQCAMCGSTVNSASAEGGTAATGLNFGILYMLAIPYIAVMAIGYLWYKKYRKRQIVMDVEDKNISLN